MSVEIENCKNRFERISNIMEDTLRSSIRNYGLASRTDELMKVATNAIDIRTLSLEESIKTLPGASRLGGLPDLPSDLSWPQWNERPIPLIAQINLADIAVYDVQDELPHTGMLYFFFEEDAFEDYPPAMESWCVIYYAGPDRDFQRAIMQSEEQRIYPPRALQFASRLSLPPFESAQMEKLGFSSTSFRKDAPPEKRREADAYGDLLESLSGDITTHHQLLGYPYQIQGDLLWECKHATEWQGESTDWQLLLQIDSDNNLDMMWGDVGVLYFYIPKQALQARDFSQVHLLMQCC